MSVPDTKICSKCKENKPLDQFFVRSNRPSGRVSECKQCYRLYADGAKKRIAENRRNWRKALPQEKKAELYEKRKAYFKKYYAHNAERMKEASAKYYYEDKSEIAVKMRGAYKEMRRINWLNRSARASGGRLSKDIAHRLLKLQKGRCACCRKPLGRKFHLDHIHPLSKGGANEDWNIQLLREKCNLNKGSKDPVQFMQERGFLL